MTDIGNLKISGGTGSGQALHTMGGAISIDAENVTVSDTGNAVFAQLSGTGTTDGVIRIAASGNIDIAASATAVAAAKLSEPDADRSITVVLTGKISVFCQAAAKDWLHTVLPAAPMVTAAMPKLRRAFRQKLR